MESTVVGSEGYKQLLLAICQIAKTYGSLNSLLTPEYMGLGISKCYSHGF